MSASFAVALLAALLPQAAKEIAAKAANTKTNFFIFLPFTFKTNIFENGGKISYFLRVLYKREKLFLFPYEKRGELCLTLYPLEEKI